MSEVGAENEEDDEWWRAQFAQNNNLLNLEPIGNQEQNEIAEIGNDVRNHDWPLEVLARVLTEMKLCWMENTERMVECPLKS
ncbi:hypothetical protein B9Z55_007862 [Caenorhabditis nigoni]|uniref:Uncharacterized protein n=1 Tax=Caenorhabditis nigoni TaxID=1611254 RepID=A0A2G5VBQ2_9PELO|nr:hypothetical protein B9Z55_007862 [Caenorhabditis nigoni]